MLTRRSLALLGAAAGLSACLPAPDQPPEVPPPPPAAPPLPAHYGAITTEPYLIPAVPEGVVPPELWRREVENPFPDFERGTIVVDPGAATLHLVTGADRALRYGVSVGRDGFGWSGLARLQFCRDWPHWRVPDEMIARQPELEPYSVANGGMAPGPDNPLGARALYLFQNGEDTLYRIHGGCEPEYLGQAVSSGCIRMLDQDVIHLESQAVHGARVMVMSATAPDSFAQVY